MTMADGDARDRRPKLGRRRVTKRVVDQLDSGRIRRAPLDGCVPDLAQRATGVPDSREPGAWIAVGLLPEGGLVRERAGAEPADRRIHGRDVVIGHAIGAVELESVDEVEAYAEAGHVLVVDRMGAPGVRGDSE